MENNGENYGIQFTKETDSNQVELWCVEIDNGTVGLSLTRKEGYFGLSRVAMQLDPKVPEERQALESLRDFLIVSLNRNPTHEP